MKIAIIGVGQAGAKLADALVEYGIDTGTDPVSAAIAVNTARADLAGLEHIPVANRVLVGQARVKGNGAGANNELGALIADEDSEEVMEAVAEVPVEETDAFLITAGLGGGTGSGGAPVYAREVSERYREPVYGLGALPGRAEGGIYQLNAARSFKTFVGEVDNLVALDNDALSPSGSDGSLASAYDAINRAMARRMGVLLTASDTDGSAGPEMVVDATEVVNTLSTGGISTVGYATTPVDRPEVDFLDRLRGVEPPGPDPSTTAETVFSTVESATSSGLSLPCDVSTAERALLVVAGPPEYLSRKGIERSVAFLEDRTETMEVRGGDSPLPDEEKVAALVIFSGVTDVPRLDELHRDALETKGVLADIRKAHPEAFADLSWADDGEIETLY
jgi:cell division GTPase FtsZ